MCVAECSSNTMTKTARFVLLRWRTQSCWLTSGCCPGAQRPQKGICFRREQCTFLLGSPPPNCMWTAIAIRCCRCHQVLEKLDARRTNLSIRFIDHRACSSAKALHRLRFSSVRSITRLSRARMVPLSVWAPHTDVDPLLLQHTWKPSDSIKGWHSAAQGLFGPTVCPRSWSSGTWRSLSAYHPSCSRSLYSVHKTALCGLVLAPPFLQQ